MKRKRLDPPSHKATEDRQVRHRRINIEEATGTTRLSIYFKGFDMRLMNIFKSITSFLKNHIWCLVVYFSTITLFLWGADGDLANRAAFAASIVSIVLAIVVIVFTIQESNRMQRIVEQFGQKVEERQEDLIKSINSGSSKEQPTKQVPISNSGSPDAPQQSAAESPERQNQIKILKYYTIKDMYFTNVTDKTNAAVYGLGWAFGFNLFNGSKGFKFHGYFPEQKPKDVMLNVKQLMKNIGDAHNKVETFKDKPESFQQAKNILDAISIDLLVAEDAPIEGMSQKITEFQPTNYNIPVNFLRLSDIEADLKKEYDSIGEL